MKICSAFLIIIGSSLLIFTLEAKTLDPYKVLGVEKNASQREIQKAFHKRSLQYHPDKNKNKSAQEKFSEINNAYEILSDEKRRKNYDLYGDDKGQPGFDASNAGDQGGYTYFTSGRPGHSGYTFRPDEWQNMGGSGGSHSFSFSFGAPGGQKSSGFGLDDIFSNLFGGGMGGGMGGGGQSGGHSTSSRSQFGSKGAPKSIRAVNSQVYGKDIVDKGMTWLLLSSMPALKGTQHLESFIEEVANSLQGALKVGSINCESESSFCKELGIHPRREARIFVYSYATSNSGSLVEFTGDLSVKSLKTFSQEHLPRFSKRTDVSQFEFSSGSERNLPKVLLLSTKKDTPVIWRALSGLYHKHVAFYDAQVHDFSDPTVRRLGVDALPAVIGWLSNGEKHILKTGISVKDMKSPVQDLSALLDSFEKKNKRGAASSQAKNSRGGKQIPLLAASNLDVLCGDATPVCIIGAFRSSREKGKLEKILSEVSRKPLSRGPSLVSGSGDSVSYVLLDASKHPSFLYSLDKSGFKTEGNVLIAYKPRKGKHAAFVGEVTSEEVEKFVGSVFNGDIKFTKTHQKPTINTFI